MLNFIKLKEIIDHKAIHKRFKLYQIWNLLDKTKGRRKLTQEGKKLVLGIDESGSEV